MAMASSSSSSSIRFIETALVATGPFALSYTDPDQKWLIRKHLTSFLQEFRNFEISTDTFNHNNGNTVQLFRLQGSLQTVKLTIWVHEDYPLTPPLVFLTSPSQTDHPFVNSSGLTKSSYVETWEYPRCNLLDSIRNLKRLIEDHRMIQTQIESVSKTEALDRLIQTQIVSVSKSEALDRLVTSLHYDVSAMIARSEEEIETLWRLQSDLKQRSESLRAIITELEREKEKVKEEAAKVEEESDVLGIWVKKTLREVRGIEEMFESESMVENLAADKAIEDVMSVLEEATERGEMEMGLYLKQVRVLAREQFFHRCFM